MESHIFNKIWEVESVQPNDQSVEFGVEKGVKGNFWLSSWITEWMVISLT